MFGEQELCGSRWPTESIGQKVNAIGQRAASIFRASVYSLEHCGWYISSADYNQYLVSSHQSRAGPIASPGARSKILIRGPPS